MSVTFDELSGESLLGPGLRIDRSRYPNFARLASESTWYRNATTVADFTSDAVPAMLTGDRPVKGKLPVESDHPGNLFSFLSRYDFNAQEPVTDLCPPDRCAEGGGQSTSTRLKDLGSDLAVVSLHKLLPDDMAEHLPAVDQGFSGFGRSGPAGGSAPSRALEDRPGNLTRFLHGIGRRVRRPTLDFSTSSCPTFPGTTCPPDSATSPRRRASRARRTTSGARTLASPARASSATCCSSRTWTGCSGACSTV